MIMARKDTMKALINRDVSEETAALLLTKYSSLSAISAAGEEELVELGLMEEEARSVLAKIGKRPASSSKVKKEVEEVVPVEPMEEVTNFYQYNEGELRLKAIAERLEIRLPMKIIVDIAARIKNADLSDEICEKLITTANRMYTAHLMDQNESAGVMAAHGLPRLIEIVDARRVPSTPSMNIPLTGTAAEDENVARYVASNIEMTTLLDIARVETDITNMRLIVTPDARKMEARGIDIDELVDRLNKVKAVRGRTGRQTEQGQGGPRNGDQSRIRRGHQLRRAVLQEAADDVRRHQRREDQRDRQHHPCRSLQDRRVLEDRHGGQQPQGGAQGRGSGC